jgi:hypothetical protein
MYPAIMEWAHHAYLQDYDYSHNLSYQAVLRRMMKKYVHVSGGTPKVECLHVRENAPINVYRFDFIKQATRLFSDPLLMNDSLRLYNPQLNPVSGERVHAEMNTGDF